MILHLFVVWLVKLLPNCPYSFVSVLTKPSDSLFPFDFREKLQKEVFSGKEKNLICCIKKKYTNNYLGIKLDFAV